MNKLELVDAITSVVNLSKVDIYRSCIKSNSKMLLLTLWLV